MVEDSTYYRPYVVIGEIRYIPKETLQDQLVWHTDEQDRAVTVLEGIGWRFQRDNQLPFELKEKDTIFIPKGEIHRVLKGSTDLKIKIQQ